LFCASRAPSQGSADCFGVGHTGVSRKLQVFYGPFGSFLVAGAAGVGNDYRNITEIGSVARCGFDSDLGR
jgi:hypothetical protein